MYNCTERVLARKKRACSTGLLMVCGVVLTASALPAWSQQHSTLMLEPITVEGNSLYGMKPTEETGGYAARAATVGTKTPATLRAIPQSVSVVTRDVIEDRNYTTLDELARGTPALRVLNNDDGRSSIYARGYEYSEANINGLPAPMASIYGTVPNLAAFDRVEVLRGPSGLFNSTSGMGGIVNLVLKQPTDTFQGHVLGRYGSWGKYHAGVDVSGPMFADGAVRGRLVAAKNGSDGFPDGNEVGSQTFYGALEFDVTPNTELSFGLLRQTHDLAPNNGVPTDPQGNLIYDYSSSTFFGADWNNFENESTDVIAELSHTFDNGGHAHVGARYSDRQGNFNYIWAGSAANPQGEYFVSGMGADYNQTTFSLDASYSQTFEALGNVGEFVVGADYKHYDTAMQISRVRRLSSVPIAAEGFGDYPYVDILDAYPSADKDMNLQAYGLYSKLTFRPVTSLALIAGARVSTYEQKIDIDGKGAMHDSRDGSVEITPYAGFVYDMNRHHSLYASYSTVFKPQNKVDVSGQLLEPREGEQYEVGIKSSYFAGALNTRVTLFQLTDENTGVKPSKGAHYSVPIVERKVQGLEVEIAGAPTPNWDIIFGYTYLDTDIKHGSGKQKSLFMLMPEHRANLWAQYRFTKGPLDGLRLGAGVTAVGDFESVKGIEAPGYVVVDAMVGYDFTDKLSAQLNVNNILDNDYYTRVGSKGTFNMRGEPANAMLSVRYDF